MGCKDSARPFFVPVVPCSVLMFCWVLIFCWHSSCLDLFLLGPHAVKVEAIPFPPPLSWLFSPSAPPEGSADQVPCPAHLLRADHH